MPKPKQPSIETLEQLARRVAKETVERLLSRSTPRPGMPPKPDPDLDEYDNEPDPHLGPY